LNHDDDWNEDLEDFWFETMRFAADTRAEAVLNLTNSARHRVNAQGLGGLRWVNIGLQQLHLPFADKLEQGEDGHPRQTIRGEIILAWPDDKFSALHQRLELKTNVTIREQGKEIAFFGPFNNRFCVLSVDSTIRFGPVLQDKKLDAALPGGLTEGIGLYGIRLDVPFGTAAPICKFYSYIYEMETNLISQSHCRVPIGIGQFLDFIQGSPDQQVPSYDGHHICIYVQGPSFLESYRRLRQYNLVFFNPRFPQFHYDTLDDILLYNEYRLKNIIDLDTGRILYELEHEIRNIRHHGLNPIREILLPITQGVHQREINSQFVCNSNNTM